MIFLLTLFNFSHKNSMTFPEIPGLFHDNSVHDFRLQPVYRYVYVIVFVGIFFNKKHLEWGYFYWQIVKKCSPGYSPRGRVILKLDFLAGCVLLIPLFRPCPSIRSGEDSGDSYSVMLPERPSVWLRLCWTLLPWMGENKERMFHIHIMFCIYM